MVQQIRVTWPPAGFNMASLQFICHHFTQLQELVMEFPGSELYKMIKMSLGAHWTDLFTAIKMLSSRGVACCMSDSDIQTWYICPTADLVEKTCQPSLFMSTFFYREKSMNDDERKWGNLSIAHKFVD